MLDYPTLKVIWWLFIGILIIGFVVMDGFDLGIATLLPFVAKTDDQRRVLLNVIGPTWEANQVWLITAGGALFAAWPIVYATVFSGFYFALLLALFALFLRPVGFDYRSKLEHPRWRQAWDWALFIGGTVPAIVFGIVFGNLLQGAPFYFDLDLRSYYSGNFWMLLNPFALLSGLVSFSMFTLHGAVYLQARTAAEIQNRCQKVIPWFALLLLMSLTLAGIMIATCIDGYQVVSSIVPEAAPNPLSKLVNKSTGSWMLNYQRFSWLWMIPVTILICTLLTVLFSRRSHFISAFITSSLALSSIVLLAGFSMYPFLLPSSTHPNSSLTLWDSSSSHTTLLVMFWATVVLLPIVIAYTSWVYRILRGTITTADINKNQHNAY